MNVSTICNSVVNFQLSSEGNINYDYGNDQFFCCRALWRAIIMQAILDLTSNSSRTEEKLAKKQAESWLLGNSIDFLDVCRWAEYSPQRVRSKALMTIENCCDETQNMRFFYTKLKKIYNTEKQCLKDIAMGFF